MVKMISETTKANPGLPLLERLKDLELRLKTIAEYPISDLADLDAVNMRLIARQALDQGREGKGGEA